MSTPDRQQPAGQPAAQPYAPAQPAPQGTNTYPGGVPAQGNPQAYAVGPQVSMSPRVSWLSLGTGIAGWVIIGLTVLLMWLSIRALGPDTDPSGADIIGFYPLFAAVFLLPVNVGGGIIGLLRAADKKRMKWKLNGLGIVLNASPYVIFFVLYFASIVWWLISRSS